VEQVFEVGRGISRLEAALIRLQSATPPLIARLRAMVEWAGVPERTDPP
jgi:hypothetical protein